MLYRAIMLALALCAVAAPASAADYPDHTIRMIVPFAAGGGTDVLARIIADSLQQEMGPAGGGGKPAGRVRRDRHPRCDEGGARWLYAADGVDRRADGGVCRRRQRRSVRRQQISQPDRDRRRTALSAGRQPETAGEDDGGPDPLCQGKAGWADLRLFRASARRRICPACCSRARPASSCCTCPTRAPSLRSPICSAGGSTSCSRRDRWCSNSCSPGS